MGVDCGSFESAAMQAGKKPRRDVVFHSAVPALALHYWDRAVNSVRTGDVALDVTPEEA
jgi:hypothetical protein